MNQDKRKPGFPAVVLAGIVLITLIAPLTASCKTTPAVEYIHEIPDVIFPVFPSVDSATYEDETGIVSVPLELWLDIAEYKIDIDAIETYIKLLRAGEGIERKEGEKR